MSITFYPKHGERYVDLGSELEPCICTQLSDAFDRALCEFNPLTAVYPQDLLSALQTAAEPTCRQCKGSGVEVSRAVLSFNLANQSASAVLTVLGFDPSYGEISFADFYITTERAVERFYALPAGPESTLESRGRVHTRALTPDGVAARLRRLLDFLNDACLHEPTKMLWG